MITRLSLCAALLLVGSRAFGATYTVNTTLDGDDAKPDGVCETAAGSGLCTIRAALREANRSTDADTVSIPTGTYPLTLGVLDVYTDVSIVGAGAATTVLTGGGIQTSPQSPQDSTCRSHVTVLAQGITVRNGGGLAVGIGFCSASAMTATFHAVVSSDNSVGLSVTNYYTGAMAVRVDESAILRNGTGITVDGGNPALVLTNCTVSANGGTGADCGGVRLGAGSAILNNLTVTGNSAGFGAGRAGGICGGGGTLSLFNSVVAGNLQSAAPSDCGRPVVSSGHNLIGDTSGCTITGDTTGNITGVSAQLGPLQYHGGPTPTHMPLAGSPLIDNGNPNLPGSGGVACESSDQRNAPRPGTPTSRCDIGAVETSACGNGVIDAGESCDDGNFYDGDCCSATCQIASSGAPCTSDGNECTTDSCDGAGACQHPAAPAGSACGGGLCTSNTCNGAGVCTHVAEVPAGCTAAGAAGASLQVKFTGIPKANKVQWKWGGGTIPDPTAFGNPLTSTDYAFCIYDDTDATPNLVFDSGLVSAAEDCSGKPCWKPTPLGAKYGNKLAYNGIQGLQLGAGVAGKAKLSVKGKGALLPLAALPLASRVTAVLRASNGNCWSADYTASTLNSAGGFSAKSD